MVSFETQKFQIQSISPDRLNDYPSMMRRIITAVTLLLIASSSSSSWGRSNYLEGVYLCRIVSYTTVNTPTPSLKGETVSQVTKIPDEWNIPYKLDVTPDIINLKGGSLPPLRYSRLQKTREDFVVGFGVGFNSFTTVKLLENGLLNTVTIHQYDVGVIKYQCEPDS